MELSQEQRQLLDEAYQQIFLNASSVRKVKAAVLRILQKGGVPAVLLMKEIGDRLDTSEDYDGR